MSTSPVNVICLKWGSMYGAEYVNRLYRGVKAHLHRQFRFVCVTEDSGGLDEGIDAQPMPPPPPEWHPNERFASWPNIFLKLALFKPGFAGLKGPTLFLDIDQIIIDDLDCFFDYKPGEFCVIHNWIEWHKTLFRKRPFVGNTSCFRFEAGSGKFDYVYDEWIRKIDICHVQKFWRTEQAFMTDAVGHDCVNWWPEDWVTSFKRSCEWPWPLNHFLVPRLRKGTRILCFHGKPDPTDAINGYRGKHLNTWVKPCPWVKELWEIR